jgi:hypothetical protein
MFSNAFGRRPFLESVLRSIRKRKRLPRLADVHPGPLGDGRCIGIVPVPVSAIRGTAWTKSSDLDFPMIGSEPDDRRPRSSRLHTAMEQGDVVPYVQLLQIGGEYWVVDGHNRVALAREFGQLWIDADVTAIDVGSPSARDR